MLVYARGYSSAFLNCMFLWRYLSIADGVTTASNPYGGVDDAKVHLNSILPDILLITLVERRALGMLCYVLVLFLPTCSYGNYGFLSW